MVFDSVNTASNVIAFRTKEAGLYVSSPASSHNYSIISISSIDVPKITDKNTRLSMAGTATPCSHL